MKNRKIYPWIVVGLLWFVALLNYMDRQMLSTMKDAMQIDIIELQSATNFGRLMAVFLWIYGLMSPMAGIIADRVSRKWLIVGSLFVWSAVTYGMGYADTFNQIYWLRALMGVSEALYIPAGLSLIADWHQEKSRSLAVGIHMTGLYAGQAIGGFGATVAAAYSWHTTFHWFGIVGIVYALVLIIFLRENEEHARGIRAMHTDKSKKIPLFKGVTLLFGNIAFWIILFYFAAPSLPGWATKNWLPTLYRWSALRASSICCTAMSDDTFSSVSAVSATSESVLLSSSSADDVDGTSLLCLRIISSARFLAETSSHFLCPVPAL